MADHSGNTSRDGKQQQLRNAKEFTAFANNLTNFDIIHTFFNPA
jgi:hypothetical protein